MWAEKCPNTIPNQITNTTLTVIGSAYLVEAVKRIFWEQACRQEQCNLGA